MVGYMKRYAATFRKAKEILDSEAIGKLGSFSAYAFSSDFEPGNRSRTAGTRGGVLRDLGSHVVDLALWFFGEMQVLSSATHSLVGFDSEDQVSFKVKTSSGLLGAFDISWCMKGYRMPEFGLRIEGSKGSLAVSDDEVKLDLRDRKSEVWYRHDLNDNVGFLLGAPEYFREDEQFVLSVINKTKVEPSFSSAARVDFLLDEVKRRAEVHER
jgi:predicted dehydrogenase